MATAPAATAAAATASPTAPSSLTLCGGGEGGTDRKAERGGLGTTTMRVGEFVEASFASFERAYGTGPGKNIASAAKETETTKTTRRDGTPEGRYHRLMNRDREEASRVENEDGVERLDANVHGEDRDCDEDGECRRHSSFWALLTSLYLPLVLLWLRRSMFGTAHLLRSLLLGHALRLVLAFVILPPPPKFLVEAWDGLTKSSCIQSVVVTLAGDYHHGAASGSGSLGVGKGHHGPDAHAWPPPALTILAALTVLAFVVHPDGLTWIMLRKIRDGLQFAFHSTLKFLGMIRDGTITTVAASSSFAGLVLLGAVIYRTLSPNRKERGGSSHQPERSRHKGKKGKKGRGRHRHGGGADSSARGRGKLRSGHYRSSKDLLGSPQARSPSRSLSPSRSRADGGGDVLNGSSDSETRVSVVSQQPEELPLRDRKMSTSTLDSAVPVADDTSCCSSLAGSMNNESFGMPATAARRLSEDGKKGLEGTKRNNGVGRSRRRKRGKRSSGNKALKQPNGGKPSLASPPLSPAAVAPPKSSPPGFLPVSSSLAAPTPPPSPLVGGVVPSHLKPIGRCTLNRGLGETVEEHGYRCSASSSFLSNPPLSTRARTHSDGGASKSFIGGQIPQYSVAVQAPLQMYPSASPGPPHFFSGKTPVPPGGSGLSQTYLRSESAPIGITSTTRLSASGVPIGRNTNMATALRYGVPNYATTYSYSHGDGRYSPGKIELAAFLAQVGLIGAACADLLVDLADVDALAALTKDGYEKYGIGTEKQAAIGVLLEARRLRKQQEESHNQRQKQWSPAVVRPPPGLGFKHEKESFGTLEPVSSAVVGAKQEQQHFLSSSTAPLRPTNSTTLPIGQPDLNLRSTHCVDSPFGSIPVTASPTLSPLPRPSNAAIPAVDDTSTAENEEEEDNSRIEADLQELGGQMAGSILDF